MYQGNEILSHPYEGFGMNVPPVGFQASFLDDDLEVIWEPYKHDFSRLLEGPKTTSFGEAKTQQVEIRSVTYASNRVRQFQKAPREP